MISTAFAPKVVEFMNEKVRTANDYTSARTQLASMLRGYDFTAIAVLPDFTSSEGTLPVGTTVIINPNRAINPNFIGMDIGCGYSFFSANLKADRFFRKGNLRLRTAQNTVDSISHGLDITDRGRDPFFGTLGGGNHFLDMFVIDEVYDPQALDLKNFSRDKVYFLAHSGSRKKGFDAHSSISMRFKSPAQEDFDNFNAAYLAALNNSGEYAKQNREAIRGIVESALAVQTTPIFDLPHNDVAVMPDGKIRIQKGTSYLEPQDLFVIPGNCTSPAYLMLGLNGLSESLYTINHGAGRVYTRSQMRKKCRDGVLKSDLREIALNVSPEQMTEEFPEAYKNVEDVVDSVVEYGLAERVAKLKPIGVIVDRRDSHDRD